MSRKLSVRHAILPATFAAFAVTRGWFAGHGHFRAYGVVTGGESSIRLALA
jgi:hypothetical protein